MSRSEAASCRRRWIDSGRRTAVAIRGSSYVRGRDMDSPYLGGVTNPRISTAQGHALTLDRCLNADQRQVLVVPASVGVQSDADGEQTLSGQSATEWPCGSRL